MNLAKNIKTAIEIHYVGEGRGKWDHDKEKNGSFERFRSKWNF